MNANKSKIPVLNALLAILFLIAVFIVPGYLVIAEKKPAISVQDFLSDWIVSDGFLLQFTYLLLMLAIALIGFIVIMFVKWLYGIITRKSEQTNPYQYKKQLPLKGFNILFSSKKYDFTEARYDCFPKKMIINTAFATSEFILPNNVPFILKGDNRFGETIIMDQYSYKGVFNYSKGLSEKYEITPITIISSCVLGKSIIRFK